MKNKILILAALLLFFSISLSSKEKEVSVKVNASSQSQLIVVSSPDLFDLTTKWATEYGKIHPDIKVKVISTTELNNEKLSENNQNIGIISNEYYLKQQTETAWKMLVGRDVIVPVFNAKNPFIKDINNQGISAKTIAEILSEPAKQNWATLLKDAGNNPLKYYISTDKAVISGISQFLNLDPDKIKILATDNDADILAKIQKDPYAIGFCKMSSVLDQNSLKLAENIKILPIDRNENGRLDYMEKIYDNPDVFQRGVWIGKYPKALCGNIYTVSANKPVNDAELGFINWIMTGGQQFLASFGFQNLVYSERQSQLESLKPKDNYAVETAQEVYSIPKTAIIILICFVAFLFGMDLLSRYLTIKKVKEPNKSYRGQNAFNENTVRIPRGIYYDKTHTWAFMDADGMVKIGIDDFFQHVTGPLTNIRMKSPGEKIKKGELLISVIQKGKQLNIYAPVSGTIVSCNNSLSTNTSLINTSPYKDGWVYTLEPVNWLRDVQFLIMADTYKQWLIKEFTRLKDFLSVHLKVHKLEYAQVILQDGGELKDGVLEDLSPEIWEDFQIKFINVFK